MENCEIQQRVQKMFLKNANAKSVEDALASLGSEIIESGDYSTCLSPQELEEMNIVIRVIVDAYRLFLQGQIEKCYSRIYDLLFKTKFLHPIFNKKILKGDKWWYRMRKNDNGYPFSKEELFHVPFQERWKISNYRYSLSGFPCLYLGSSIYDCWEELNRPDFYYANVSGFKLQRDINVIDLRFPQHIVSPTDFYVLPLITACSVQVKNENANFKPEYIISQAILHAIIRHTDSKTRDNSFNGLLTYSSNCGNSSNLFENKKIFENLILPTVTNTIDSTAEKIYAEGYCPILINTIGMTEPTSFYLYDLSKRQSVICNLSDDNDYLCSKFAEFENYIKTLSLSMIRHCKFLRINRDLICHY